MRWRDVKQGKITKNITKSDELKKIPYATIKDRLKAFITDAFLLSMPIFYIVVYLVFDGLRGDSGVESHRGLAWLYILIPLGIVYTLFCYFKGQTPGMKAYDLKIVDNTTLDRPNVLLIALRYIFFNIILFTVIGLVVPFFRKDRRGLQDLLSRTSLVRVDGDK